MPVLTPHLTPTVGLTLDGQEFTLEESERLLQQLSDAVRLLRYHDARQRGGRATAGLSTPAKRRAARRNGKKGGRPRKGERP